MAEFTVNEIVSILKHSDLTTILVEGKDDMLIYRWMENDHLKAKDVHFFPCGGRNKLLEVYERRAEFSQIKTVFVADKDAFIYDENLPEKYSEVVWTKGYSIENDLYHGKQIEKLLDSEEDINFRTALKNFITYYGYSVERYQKTKKEHFANRPEKVLSDNYELNSDFLKKVQFIQPTKDTITYLSEDYDLLLRGKNLFDLLLIFLSHKDRKIKHNKKALLESCFKLHPNEAIKNLIISIVNKL